MAGRDKTGDGPASGKVVPLRPARECPICGKNAVRGFYPFCSRRCADIDLNRWLRGSYAIAAAEDDGRVEGTEAGDDES